MSRPVIRGASRTCSRHPTPRELPATPATSPPGPIHTKRSCRASPGRAGVWPTKVTRTTVPPKETCGPRYSGPSAHSRPAVTSGRRWATAARRRASPRARWAVNPPATATIRTARVTRIPARTHPPVGRRSGRWPHRSAAAGGKSGTGHLRRQDMGRGGVRIGEGVGCRSATAGGQHQPHPGRPAGFLVPTHPPPRAAVGHVPEQPGGGVLDRLELVAGENAILACYGSGGVRTSGGWWVSHTRRVRSPDPDTSRRPSGLKATAWT